jgi:hypothetical protein
MMKLDKAQEGIFGLLSIWKEKKGGVKPPFDC